MSPCGHPDYTFSTLQSLDTCLKSHLTGQRRPEQAFQLPNAPGPNGPAARQARTRAPREARDPCNEFVSHHATPKPAPRTGLTRTHTAETEAGTHKLWGAGSSSSPPPPAHSPLSLVSTSRSPRERAGERR